MLILSIMDIISKYNKRNKHLGINLKKLIHMYYYKSKRKVLRFGR